MKDEVEKLKNLEIWTNLPLSQIVEEYCQEWVGSNEYEKFKRDFYAALLKAQVEAVRAELEHLKGWGWGTDFGGHPLTYTNRTPEDILARIENRLANLTKEDGETK